MGMGNSCSATGHQVPAVPWGYGGPVWSQECGAPLNHVDVRFPFSYGNMGLFLSHMAMGLPLDYGEMGLHQGDLGFLLCHRDEGFPLSWGDGGLPLGWRNVGFLP